MKKISILATFFLGVLFLTGCGQKQQNKQKEVGMVADTQKQEMMDFIKEDSDSLFKISLISAKDRGDSLDKNHKAKGHYIEAIVKIESVSTHTINSLVSANYFHITDDKGKLDIRPEGPGLDSDKEWEDLKMKGSEEYTLVPDTLHKGESMTFDLFFDVPTETKGIYLVYTGEGGEAPIDLGL